MSLLKRFSSRIKESLFSFREYIAHNISLFCKVVLIQKLALFFSDNAVIGRKAERSPRNVNTSERYFQKLYRRPPVV